MVVETSTFSPCMPFNFIKFQACFQIDILIDIERPGSNDSQFQSTSHGETLSSHGYQVRLDLNFVQVNCYELSKNSRDWWQ